jgi:galactokinase
MSGLVPTSDESTVPNVAAQFQRAAEVFAHRFGVRPHFAAQAPGRINLIGEHTDYNGGFVLPMAIDRQAVIVASACAKTADSGRSTLWSLDLDEVVEVDLRQPLVPMPGVNATYMLGVIDQFVRMGYAVENLNVALTSSVPIGAGLSSSAAVEVATATLVEQVTGAVMPPLEKVKLCQRAEHTFPGAPVGIMDMYISVCAKADHALLIDCQSDESQPVPMPPAEEALVLIVDTRVKHSLADGAYADRRRTCEQAAAIMGVPSLRHATLDLVESAPLNARQRQRATHVVQEIERTLAAARALGRGDLDHFGSLMFDSHASLRDLFEVSCAELDLIVEVGQRLRQAGVLGARMTGGGFGGCAILLVQPHYLHAIQRAIKDAFVTRFGRAPRMFSSVAAGPAGAIEVG